MQKRYRAALMWGVVSLLMVLHFFLMLSVGVITTELRINLNLSALQLSFLASSYLYVYLLLQTPAGILSDHFGARKLLSVGSLVCALGCWIFAHSHNLTQAMFARALMGGGLAFVFISSVQLASRWFDKRYFGLMIGMAEGAGMAGVIIANMLLAIFMHKIGWRNSFELAAYIALAFAVLSWLWVHDYPNPSIEHVKFKDKLTIKKAMANMQVLVREPQIWLQSGYISLMYTSITVFSGLWANPFLRRAFDLSLEQATLACSLVLAGIGIGSPIVGIFCHTTELQIRCERVCSVLMLIILCTILYVPTLSLIEIYVLMFLLGASGGGIILGYAIVSNIASEGAKSTSVGFTNALSFTGAIVCQPLVGWLLNRLSNTIGKNGIEYYTAANYRAALTVLPVCISLAIMISLLIHSDFKRRKH